MRRIRKEDHEKQMGRVRNGDRFGILRGRRGGDDGRFGERQRGEDGLDPEEDRGDRDGKSGLRKNRFRMECMQPVNER